MGCVPVMGVPEGVGVGVGVGDAAPAIFEAGTKTGSPVRWLSMTVANARKRPPAVVVRTTA